LRIVWVLHGCRLGTTHLLNLLKRSFHGFPARFHSEKGHHLHRPRFCCKNS
jgi:hypothetical protein